MKIKVRHNFWDKRNDGKLRKKDELLEVDADRGKELISLKLAEELEPDQTEQEKEKPEGQKSKKEAAK